MIIDNKEKSIEHKRFLTEIDNLLRKNNFNDSYPCHPIGMAGLYVSFLLFCTSSKEIESLIKDADEIIHIISEKYKDQLYGYAKSKLIDNKFYKYLRACISDGTIKDFSTFIKVIETDGKVVYRRKTK